MIIIGIDPGLKGGIAFLNVETRSVCAEPMPLGSGDIDVWALRSMIVNHAMQDGVEVWVEKVHAMPKNGSIASFRLGEGSGIVRGVVGALGMSLRMVAPQTWKALILKGTPKDKAAAIDYVLRTWPGVDLTPGQKRAPHDGMADALCIAEYGFFQWRNRG